MKDFKKLLVWQKAILLARGTYILTLKIPDEEKFGLVSQMRRCAVSIPSNIAEGSKRQTDKDYRQFLAIAAGSAAELETQLILTRDIYKLDTSELDHGVEEIQKMLQSFMRKL